MKYLHVELYSGSTTKFTKMTQEIIYEIVLYLNIYKAHILHLLEEPFHFLIRFLNTFKVWQIFFGKANYYKFLHLKFPSF